MLVVLVMLVECARFEEVVNAVPFCGNVPTSAPPVARYGPRWRLQVQVACPHQWQGTIAWVSATGIGLYDAGTA